MKCTICGADERHAFSHRVLGKYDCRYFVCDSCGFLHAEEAYWLDEAYSSAISFADTGLVHRNLKNAKILSAILFLLFDRHGRYLDVAGGYGLLTRLMRDNGFDFYWRDKYCQNLLARGFEAERVSPPFTAVTAFEVLEHVQEPLGFIEDALLSAGTKTIFFSTELYDGVPPHPEDWWYYAFGTGQHISFYKRKTMQLIAKKLGLNYYVSGSMHLLTDHNFSHTVYKLTTNRLLSELLCVIQKGFMKSKMICDHDEIMNNIKQ